jgi:two-component system, cell cycle response regulator DivK
MAMNTSRYAEAAEATPTSERRYKAKRKRILVVEMDRLSFIVLRQLLTAQGYEILQSSEGWDGINRARIEQPDLIVIDMKLPDICGIDAARLLKQHHETTNIPIIALTAFAGPGDEGHALENGCDAFLAKPINMNNLLRTVDLFLASASLP